MSQIELFPQPEVQHATPILKWAGGKGRLLRQFKPYFPSEDRYRHYFEPFLGGGAVFFFLKPTESYLFDLNSQLVGTYQVVKENVEGLIEALKHHKNDKEYFYYVRGLNPLDLNPVENAARFIFLNKTCYNGLYRVNKNGQFNVPFGRYDNPTICDEKGLRAASAALKNAHLHVGDFEQVLQYPQKGDLVYFDPPYEPLSATSNFTSYTSNGFSRDQQKRLAEVFRTLDNRGCLLMLSNSDTPFIQELYAEYHLHKITARRAINSDPNGRGKINEILVTNFLSQK